MNGVMWFSLAAILGLALLVPLSMSKGERIGYDKGLAAGRLECQQDTVDELTVLINSSQYLVEQANTTSMQLAKTISDRQQADAQSTREIRNALTVTASDRAGCVFDAGVMQQLDTARHRAAEAAASGLGSTVPAPD